MTKSGKKTVQAESTTFCSVLIISNVICAVFLFFGMAIPSVADDAKPVAKIDGTLRVTAGNTVYLDGSFSSDPGGNELSYRWTLEDAPSASIATMSDDGDVEASFEADVVGTYRVKLVVNNGLVDSDPVYATIIATE